MSDMAAMAMPTEPSPWTVPAAALRLSMWWIMMAGMMLPGAIPMILTFVAVNRRKRARGQPFVSTAIFTAGYLVVWGLFGVVATLAEGGLEQTMLAPARRP